MNVKAKRRTLIDPILLLLKSRRVVIALASLLVAIVVLCVPQLAAFHMELLVVVVTLALALITGLSLEDAVIAARQTELETDVQRVFEEAMNAILEGIFSAGDEIEETSSQAADGVQSYEI